MRRITALLAVGLLIGSLVTQATLRAQQSEPAAKGPKLTLNSIEAQVSMLQGQVASLQSTVNSLQSNLNLLQMKVTSQPTFAVVDGDGALTRGSANVVKTERISRGVYEVTFNKDISNCAYNATLALGGVVAEAIDAAPAGATSVRITIFSILVASTADEPFQLSVICG
jgi:hypothetical protein